MTAVPPGVSGGRAQYNGLVTTQQLANEVALLNLGPFEPLAFKVDVHSYMQEIAQFDDAWVEYLPRTDRPNNREALTLTNLPGRTHQDAPSLAQVTHQLGRKVSELEFNTPTDVYRECKSLHPVLEAWEPLGRSFIVKSNVGGYFVPHRDHPSMPRDVFRLIVFLNNCGPLDYDWLMDDRKMLIEHGRLYYVNTRLTHRTISWVNNSQHMIMNIPFTTANVSKVIASLAHTH